MHTIIVIVGGLSMLGLFMLIGRLTDVALSKIALYFIPVWLVVAAANMWIGVVRAGYPVAEELPIFLIIFAIPAAAAGFLWWKLSPG
ncbi:MAG: hypothetical protein ACREVN_07080 [Gammaproteobacteria bacterium]